jgi:hypothetical protein
MSGTRTETVKREKGLLLGQYLIELVTVDVGRECGVYIMILKCLIWFKYNLNHVYISSWTPSPYKLIFKSGFYLNFLVKTHYIHLVSINQPFHVAIVVIIARISNNRIGSSRPLSQNAHFSNINVFGFILFHIFLVNLSLNL